MAEKNNANGVHIGERTVGTRYPNDRIGLLDVVKVRWGKAHRSEVVKVALDRVLVQEGLLSEGEAA